MTYTRYDYIVKDSMSKEQIYNDILPKINKIGPDNAEIGCIAYIFDIIKNTAYFIIDDKIKAHLNLNSNIFDLIPTSKSSLNIDELNRILDAKSYATKEITDGLQSAIQNLTTKLHDYFDTVKLDNYLKDYIKLENLNSKLEDYAKIEKLDAFYSKQQIDSKFENINNTINIDSIIESKKLVDEPKLNTTITEKLKTLMQVPTVSSAVQDKINEVLTAKNYIDLNSLTTKIQELKLANEDKVKDLISTNEKFDNYYDKSNIDQKVQDLNTKITNSTTPEQAKELVKNEIKSLVKNAPESLDTIAEIATALKNNPEVITEILNKIESKLNKTDAAENSKKLNGLTADKFALKSELDNLNQVNYYNKAQTENKFLSKTDGLSKSEADTKYQTKLDSISKTTLESTYLKKQDAFTETQADSKYLKKTDGLTNTQAESTYAKKTDILDKTTILTKQEADTIYTKTANLDSKYLKIADAFKETTADAKYAKKSDLKDSYLKSETYKKDEVYNKTEVYNKAESDGRYLPKNAKIKITGDVVSEIQDSNEIPFRLNSDGEIKFVPYSVIKATGGSGGASGEAVRKAIKDEVRTQVGNFSLGDGYLIAKSLEPYIPGLNIPARVYGKGVTNLNIEFELLTNSGGDYGNGFGAIIFYRDGKRYYPKYKNPSNSAAESTVILSLTEQQGWDNTKWNNLPAIPSDYTQEVTDLKVLIKSDKCYSFGGSYNSISCLAGLSSLYFLSDSTPSKITMNIISNDNQYFDTLSFSAGKDSRYTNTLNLKFKSGNNEIYNEFFTLAKNQTKTIKTVFKELAESLPEVEKTKIIKGLEDYAKGYVDTELNKETYIKRVNLNKEVKDAITEQFKDSNAAQEAVNVWTELLGKMGFTVPLNPTRKPPKTKIIFDNLSSTRAAYGPTLGRIRLFDGNKKLYLAGYETISNTAPFKVLFSETNPNKTFTELLNNNLKTYTPKTGEYLGTISTTNNYSGVTYNPIQSFANDNGASTYYLGTKGKNCKFELELENLYPSKITVTNGVTEAYCTDTFEIKIYDENNCIGYKKIENFGISALIEYETLRISQRQFTGAEGILNGNEVKEIIKETVKTDVQTKFNEIDFLSSDNLDTKIDLRLPTVAQTFFENGGMEKYLEKVFNLVGQDFPVTLTQKPTVFTLKIDSFGEYVGYAALGTIKMTNNEDKLLYLKEISTGYTVNKPLKVILTTDPAKGCVGSVPSKDLSNYVLQADEYEAEVQGFNTYNNGTYYLPYYVLTQKETNPSSYLTYYMGASNVGAGIRITIKNFYPKTLEIKNGIPGRYTKEYRVKMYNGNDCYFNRLVKDQNDPAMYATIKIPKFD